MAQEPAKPAWQVFLASFREPLIIILLVAVGIALLSAGYEASQGNTHWQASVYEAVTITIIVFINAGLTFHQSRSAEKSLAALRQLRQPKLSVLRSGEWHALPVVQLVPGDIVSVKVGDFIQGDLRFIKTAQLQVDESALTGESEPSHKTTEILKTDTPLADRTNMGFSGTMVVNGTGLGAVTTTGMQTELGKIAGLMQAQDQQKTPIERAIAALAKQLMWLSAGIITLTVVFELVRQFLVAGQIGVADVAKISSTAIAIAVASIPDAMPVVLSIVLTIGVKLLAEANGLVKSLSSVETLGAASYIASDKTGTLTKNEMTVTRLYTNRQQFTVEGSGYTPVGDILTPAGESVTQATYQRLFEVAVLDNEAEVRQDVRQNWQPFGNPTDVALVVMAQKAGITRIDLLDTQCDILRVFPFDSRRKVMSVVVKAADHYYLLTKGALEILAKQSQTALVADGVVPYSQLASEVKDVMADFANNALRTLALAQRELSPELAEHGELKTLERELCFIGLVGMMDPPREEVKQAISQLHGAGIQVVMITGDHPGTATAIAKHLGIVSDAASSALLGSEIDQMSDAALAKRVTHCRVYARVTPSHKQRIVHQLQEQGQVVAMTGDGINDAPALKAADIGVAMGINGTEVTKDAADLILLDDKFTTIAASVASGRTIFANILNFIRHELTTNVAEVLALLLGVLLLHQNIGQVSAATPTLTALMVLWVNMVSDSLPSFALGYDEAEADVMCQKPRHPGQSLLANGMLGRVLSRGISMGVWVFAGFIWAGSQGYTTGEAQTIAFLILVFGQLWHVYDARSTKTLFDRNPFTNSRLTLAVAFVACASVLVTLMPFFNDIMGTRPLSVTLYLGIIAFSALPTLVLSAIKKWVYANKH